MQCRITYIHHNCFVLAADTRTFLFDCPGDGHLPRGSRGYIRDAIAGTDLMVFVSHGHDDHLNRDLSGITASAASVSFVLSDDIEEMHPEVVPNNGPVRFVEPDETYAFAGLHIETLMSNDLGVAFLVSDGPFRFYYGGDLAEWIWETASPKEAEFTASYYRESLNRVRQFGPHVAFSNVDGRLANLAGGVEACQIIKPKVFVPMHTFGNVEWLDDFAGRLGPTETELFLYREIGQTAEFSFEFTILTTAW